MRKIHFAILLGMTFTNAFSQQPSQQTAENFSKLHWLENTWIRTNNKAGQSGLEKWEKFSPGEYRGKGIAMRGNDTLFVEKISILIKDDHLYYVADVPENKEPVYFKLIEISDTGFVCENPKHDFPKRITYQSDKNVLKASISGGGKVIDYYFKSLER